MNLPVLFLSLLFGANPIQADLVLKNGSIYDGSGSPPIKGDVAIFKDKIVAIGTFEVQGSPKIIDVKGHVVAPGFIDLHTHSDYPMQKAPTNANRNYLTQGVTTVVTGNCGSGPVDTAAFYKNLEKAGIGSNVAHQVPHNDVRAAVMGNVNREPTPEELLKMEKLVEKAMKDGAWGLSTGLIYNPGTYSKTPELVTLAKVASAHGGFYASHIRDEGSGVLTAVNEAITIGMQAKLPVHVSHIKVSGRNSWGKAGDVVALISQARKNGIKVTADQYPYTASSTSLKATLVPSQFREGSLADYTKRYSDPEVGPRLRTAIEDSLKSKKNGEDIRIASYGRNAGWSGKNLVEIAKITGKTPLEVVLEIEKNGGAQIVHFGMNEEDMRLFMKQDFVSTASDGGSKIPDKSSVPHPRSYGTFSRKIGFYSIEQKWLPLEQAIRSSSGLPADIIGFTDRGYLKAGYIADVVVLDPEKFRDKATYEKPHQYSEGVIHLFVNGVPVIEETKATGKLPGMALRKSQK